MSRAQLNAYRDSSLRHASGSQLVAACFREAGKALAEARRQIESGTAASSYTPLERTRRIYTHLYATLDLKQGGALAERMQRLYAYVIEQCLAVSQSYDLKQLASLEQITADQLDAWQALAPSLPAESLPGQAGSIAASG
jgi:flagellar protein FliS